MKCDIIVSLIQHCRWLNG